MVAGEIQQKYITRKAELVQMQKTAKAKLSEVKKQIEKLILGTLSVEEL